MSTNRPSNRDRFLLSLLGSEEYHDRFEYPRRFSQRGLIERLGMAQSHISRTVKTLLDEKLIISERRRVANEVKRVVAYRLSEKGIIEVENLKASLAERIILYSNEDGELSRATVSEYLRGKDALTWATILKNAESHDGMLVIKDSEEEDIEELNISSETITLLIELADLKMNQGNSKEAAEDLRRAAILHKRQGNNLGEARCILTAAGLDGVISDPKRTLELVKKCGVLSFSADEILTMWSNIHEKEIIQLSPEHIQQYIRCSIGEIPLSMVPESIDGSALQNVLWRGKRLSLQLDLSPESVDDTEVMEVLNELSTGQASRPEMVADIALKHGQESSLQAAWKLDLSVNSAGHVGFSLYNLNGDKGILQTVLSLFSEVDDKVGIEVCKQLLS